MDRFLRSVGFVFLVVFMLWLLTNTLKAQGVHPEARSLATILFVGANICSFVFGGAGR